MTKNNKSRAAKKTGQKVVSRKAEKGSTPRSTSRKSASKKSAATNGALKVYEKRRHPRFILTREQFREVRTGKIYPVYDLSMNGLSIKIDEQLWEPGAIVGGVLNLHPDSIEVSPRLVAYYGDRAALKIEVLSTYGRTVLNRALSPKRLGASLQLIHEKMPVADYWFHGVCNTDLLIRLTSDGKVSRAELFFANYYWCWNEDQGKIATGICQSMGQEKRDELFLADEPVTIESLGLFIDGKTDEEKNQFARAIVEASPLEPRIKDPLLKKFENL